MQHAARPRGAAPARWASLIVGAVVLTLALTAPAGALTPADPGAQPAAPPPATQWYQAVLGLAAAQRISQGAGTVVAVIDGGVDASSPHLRGQLVRGAGVGPDAATDGWRDDDPDGHGTAMAGLIAGRAADGAPEVRGIAPAARILPISTGVEADSAEVAVAIHRAIDLGAGVINLSLGSAGDATADEREAVAFALDHDVVVVASAGNTDTGDTDINSPASIPGVVAVTGSTAQGGFWRGSVQGTQAVLAAPAPGIRAPVPTRVSPDGLDTGSGTSNSAAIVAGVVALIRSARPELDAPNVIERLLATARDAGPRGRDVEFGFGIVDPVAALTRPVPVVTSNPLLAAPTRWGAPGQPPAGATPQTTGPAGAGAGAGAGGPGATAVPPLADDGARSGTATGPAATDPAVGTGTGGEVPAPAGGSQRTAADTTADGGRRASAPSPLVWVVGLTVAVVLGGALGVGAHLLAAALRRRRTRAARVDRAVAPYPSSPLGRTDRVPASTGRQSRHS